MRYDLSGESVRGPFGQHSSRFAAVHSRSTQLQPTGNIVAEFVVVVVVCRRTFGSQQPLPLEEADDDHQL